MPDPSGVARAVSGGQAPVLLHQVPAHLRDSLNAGLHAVNAVLLFLLLWRMTGSLWRSGFVAALFAWHPRDHQPAST